MFGLEQATLGYCWVMVGHTLPITRGFMETQKALLEAGFDLVSHCFYCCIVVFQWFSNVFKLCVDPHGGSSCQFCWSCSKMKITCGFPRGLYCSQSLKNTCYDSECSHFRFALPICEPRGCLCMTKS